MQAESLKQQNVNERKKKLNESYQKRQKQEGENNDRHELIFKENMERRKWREGRGNKEIEKKHDGNEVIMKVLEVKTQARRVTQMKQVG